MHGALGVSRVAGFCALSLVFEALLQHEHLFYAIVDLPVEKGLLVKTTL